MLKAISLIVALIICQASYAQINIPIDKGMTPVLRITKQSPTIRLQELRDSFRISQRDAFASKMFSDSPRYEKVIQENIMRQDRANKASASDNLLHYDDLSTAVHRSQVNSAIAQLMFDYEYGETDRAVRILNEETSPFQPLITGGLSNLFSEESAGKIGTLSIGLQYRVSPFRRKVRYKAFPNKRINEDNLDRYDPRKVQPVIDPHFIYASFNISTAKSADSNNILKTILFPELAKNDFILGWYNTITSGNFIRGWRAEAVLTTYDDTSGRKLFRSESLMLGYHVAFLGNLPRVNVPAGLKAMLYANVINIDPKYNAGRDSVLGRKVIMHNTFFNLGLRVQTEVEGATLFFNGKYILNRHGAVEEPDLIRFVYTIGALVSL